MNSSIIKNKKKKKKRQDMNECAPKSWNRIDNNNNSEKIQT